MAKKKPHRPKLIGDPLKKFKQLHKGQDITPAMREYLERAMEQDHSAGLPLRAAMFVSARSNMPDLWFFDKARAIGYRIEESQGREFFESQLKQCYTNQDRIPQYVRDFEYYLLLHYSQESVVRMWGSIEKFREMMENQLRESQSSGRTPVFCTNTSFRSNTKEDVFFLEQVDDSLRAIGVAKK